MNLLVTGGAGFIGSNLVRFLAQQPGVRRLVNLDCLTYAGHLENLTGMAEHPGYAFEKVNLCDKAGVVEVVSRHQITHVMHLAAESHVDRSITGPADFIHTNIVGTFHLLEACRDAWAGDAEGRRFLHVSTDEVYGSLGPEGLFSETTPYAPNSPYSASKAAADMLVRSYHHTYGLPVLITNSSNNYGPYQYPEKLIPVAIQSLLARQPVPVYGDGQNVRDWLHVDDHVRGLWLVLNGGRAGETYNIGGGQEMANLQLVGRLCDLVDELRPDLGGGSRKLIRFVEDRPGHDRRYAIDATKITRELGWRPSRTLEEGLRQTVAWYLEHQAWVKAVTEKN
jgi:dTDP-glucose 4,6-dehydratase